MKKGNMKKGFTLIELIVTIALFLIVFGAIIASFVAAVRHQSIILAQQEALSQISYAMELMSRTLRMAAFPPPNGNCVLQGGSSNYSVSDSSIQFINSLENSACQKFFLESDVLKYMKDVNDSSQIFPLTSDRVKVETLKFVVTAESNQKPRVSILLVASSKVPGVGKMRFQTTLSQRN